MEIPFPTVGAFRRRPELPTGGQPDRVAQTGCGKRRTTMRQSPPGAPHDPIAGRRRLALSSAVGASRSDRRDKPVARPGKIGGPAGDFDALTRSDSTDQPVPAVLARPAATVDAPLGNFDATHTVPDRHGHIGDGIDVDGCQQLCGSWRRTCAGGSSVRMLVESRRAIAWLPTGISSKRCGSRPTAARLDG